MAVLSPQEIAEASERLAGRSPQEVLRWAAEMFYPRLTMATAFGAEGCVLIHMLADIEPRVRIFNLETGYQFKETMDLRERIKERYGIEVHYEKPDMPVDEYEAFHGGPLYDRDPDQCCHDRKIVLNLRATTGYDAWISAIRADQTEHRAQANVVQWDRKFSLIKVSPLLSWTRKDVWDFILKHDVPYNPLHDQGFPSIGCWPCTRAVVDGEGERAGRWGGRAKKECGLHIFEKQADQGTGI